LGSALIKNGMMARRGYSGGVGSTDLMTVKVSLNTAQLQSLSSIPEVVIAAPGENKAIEIISACYLLTDLVTAPDGIANIELYTRNSERAQFITPSGDTISNTSVNNTMHKFYQIDPTTLGTDSIQLIENEPIEARANADSVAIECNMNIYITYRIIDL
jgi:hypothetical protein